MPTKSLPAADKKLLAAALAAARKSYSPYSRFSVGAALLTEDGRVFTGCNVENASYGLTLCAERVAISAAVAAGCRRFTRLAIAGGTKRAARPCGACLQVMAEFCEPRFRILMVPLDDPKKVERAALRDLLPQVFSFAKP
jgi:cytidine deaminase